MGHGIRFYEPNLKTKKARIRDKECGFCLHTVSLKDQTPLFLAQEEKDTIGMK